MKEGKLEKKEVRTAPLGGVVMGRARMAGAVDMPIKVFVELTPTQ